MLCHSSQCYHCLLYGIQMIIRFDYFHCYFIFLKIDYLVVEWIPEWRFGFSGNNFCCFRLSEDFRVKIAVVPDTVFLQLKVRYQILWEESILSFLELLRAFLPCCNTNILFKIQAGCLVGKSTQSMKNFDRGTSLPLPRVKPNVICTAVSHTTQHGLSHG